jgi:hypothetical protein
VLGRFQGNVAVLEDPYLEMEFWDTYSFFHSRSFLGRRKQCWRVHFFRHRRGHTGTRAADIISLLSSGVTQTQLARKGFKYLGFTTLRPVRSFSLGRTAILFDTAQGSRAKEGEDPLEATGRSFCKGKAEQFANVCATQLNVATVPFLQQDPVAGMCVTASLWITSQVLASKFELHKYPYIDISRQATLPTAGASLAPASELAQDFTRGLSPVETCAALVKTGALPLLIIPKPFRDNPARTRAHLKNQLYTFVESELPVIVFLLDPEKGSRHAVTAVGHLLPRVDTLEEMKNCTVSHASPQGSHLQYLVSLAVKRFYVHNDAYGPFDRLDFLEPQEVPQGNARPWICPMRLSRQPDRALELQSIVIPVPPYVKNRPDNIIEDASRRFGRLFWDESYDERRARVLWRMLLVRGSRFKQSLTARGWPATLVQKYATLHLPKFIWLCELSLFEEPDIGRLMRPTARRLVHGEFIYDTTTPYYSINVLVQRLGAYFVTEQDAWQFRGRRRERALARSCVPGVDLEPGLPCFTGPV